MVTEALHYYNFGFDAAAFLGTYSNGQGNPDTLSALYSRLGGGVGQFTILRKYPSAAGVAGSLSQYSPPMKLSQYNCLLLVLAACGGGGGGGSTPDAAPKPDAPASLPAGPYDAVALSEDLRLAGLAGPVHAVRDRFGILHIHAESMGDLALVQGYLTARDRLPQMEILRRLSSGTLSELFGAVDSGVVDTDIEMRMHRLRPVSQKAYDALKASSDSAEATLVTLLDRYAEGINIFIGELSAGDVTLDSEAAAVLPAEIPQWTAIDSLALGRFQSLGLSLDASTEIGITTLYQQALQVFDNAPLPGDADFDADRDARRNASLDLLRFAPVGRTATVDGFPNQTTATPQQRTRRTAATAGHKSGKKALQGRTRRPQVPLSVLANARHFFSEKIAFGPQAFAGPHAGSNNWVVGPKHTGGQAFLAGDQHLSLPNPSVFYPVHLVIPDQLDAQGVTFPGIPGIILGHNGTVAWTSTVVNHDANDVYMETIVPCTNGDGDCVVFNSEERPIETWTEDIAIGLGGTISETRQVTFEEVPHHGPIIPTIKDGQIVPRTESTALSVRFTGYEVTQEVAATYKLLVAKNMDEALVALDDFGFGAQNWLLSDTEGNIAWSTSALVPQRSADTFTWNPETAKDGLAPFFILPGDGCCEWEGYVARSDLPGAINPEQGYLVTANSDPVGATFDGNPLNDGTLSDRPRYIGVLYAVGLRTERITELIKQRIDNQVTITLDELADIQHDSQSTMGAKLRARMVEALGKIDSTDRTQDVTDWVADADPATLEKLRQASSYLENWTLETPPAVLGTPSATEQADSTATTLFNVWMHHVIDLALGDEYEAMELPVYEIDDNINSRTIVAIFTAPESLQSQPSPVTQQPILCEDMRTADVTESCDLIAIMAMEQTLTWLASADGLGTDDMTEWRWGRLHTLTLDPLIPNPVLNVPAGDDPNEALRNGFPRPGDNFGVNAANGGYRDLRFTFGGGAAQRFLAGPGADGRLRVRLALPGGTIFNRDSAHYRDLLDDYYLPHKHFNLPYATSEIVTEGEARLLLRAP